MEKLFFLVPTLGERKYELKRLLHSLENQSYKDFTVIIVSQMNFTVVDNIVEQYKKNINIIHLKCNDKGLSKARNYGIRRIESGIIILSDDDCWYPSKAAEEIMFQFEHNKIDILLTRIYAPEQKRLYKQYGNSKKRIRNKIELLSRSSIEIAFRINKVHAIFDEKLGVGTSLPCGEEIDFLLNNFKKNIKIIYVPKITVYHPKKENFNRDCIKAKGYLYHKNFSLLLGIVVCFRDLFLKKENNFKDFFDGYNKYRIKKDSN